MIHILLLLCNAIALVNSSVAVLKKMVPS